MQYAYGFRMCFRAAMYGRELRCEDHKISSKLEVKCQRTLAADIASWAHLRRPVFPKDFDLALNRRS
jgi:hypothetical protein